MVMVKDFISNIIETVDVTLAIGDVRQVETHNSLLI
jgi:hypothetical protein